MRANLPPLRLRRAIVARSEFTWHWHEDGAVDAGRTQVRSLPVRAVRFAISAVPVSKDKFIHIGMPWHEATGDDRRHYAGDGCSSIGNAFYNSSETWGDLQHVDRIARVSHPTGAVAGTDARHSELGLSRSMLC